MELRSGPATSALSTTRTSIWPSIYPRILELIGAHRSTIIFCNARRQAERLALLHDQTLSSLRRLADAPLTRDCGPVMRDASRSLRALFGALPFFNAGQPGTQIRVLLVDGLDALLQTFDFRAHGFQDFLLLEALCLAFPVAKEAGRCKDKSRRLSKAPILLCGEVAQYGGRLSKAHIIGQNAPAARQRDTKLLYMSS